MTMPYKFVGQPQQSKEEGSQGPPVTREILFPCLCIPVSLFCAWQMYLSNSSMSHRVLCVVVDH